MWAISTYKILTVRKIWKKIKPFYSDKALATDKFIIYGKTNMNTEKDEVMQVLRKDLLNTSNFIN